MQKTFVDIRPLKRVASELLGSSSVLRRVMSSEEDAMPPTDYVAKLSTWLAILDSDLSGREYSA
jgi:hypothetical protein